MEGKQGLRIIDLMNAALAEEAQAKPQAQAPQGPKVGPYDGIRNVPSYQRAMANINAVTDTALNMAPTPEAKMLVGQIADAQTPLAKKALAIQMKSKFPELSDYIKTYVDPITDFGPK